MQTTETIFLFVAVVWQSLFIGLYFCVSATVRLPPGHLSYLAGVSGI
jgi:hypothetical protein